MTTGGARFNGCLAEFFIAAAYIDITPAIYLARDYANWHTNLGSGGNFTVVGAIERGTTSPSDTKVTA